MGWQTQVAVQLQAGNTIINPDGLFVYSGTPALGSLIASICPVEVNDQFGNDALQGITSYFLNSGKWFAAQVFQGDFNLNTAASSAGPWTFTGDVSIDFTTGNLDIESEKGINFNFINQPVKFNGAAITASGFPLPNDSNSGSTWVSGERTFMNNNWVAPINNLISAMQSAGLIQ
jgi:hypothetical protein